MNMSWKKTFVASGLLMNASLLLAADSTTTRDTSRPAYETKAPIAPVVSPPIPGPTPTTVTPAQTNKSPRQLDRERARALEIDDINRRMKENSLSPAERRVLQGRLDNLTIDQRKTSSIMPPPDPNLPTPRTQTQNP